MQRAAFNVGRGEVEMVDDIDGGLYTTHRPNAPPYQSADFKPRCLWVHNSNT